MEGDGDGGSVGHTVIDASSVVKVERMDEDEDDGFEFEFQGYGEDEDDPGNGNIDTSEFAVSKEEPLNSEEEDSEDVNTSIDAKDYWKTLLSSVPPVHEFDDHVKSEVAESPRSYTTRSGDAEDNDWASEDEDISYGSNNSKGSDWSIGKERKRKLNSAPKNSEKFNKTETETKATDRVSPSKQSPPLKAKKVVPIRRNVAPSEAKRVRSNFQGIIGNLLSGVSASQCQAQTTAEKVKGKNNGPGSSQSPQPLQKEVIKENCAQSMINSSSRSLLLMRKKIFPSTSEVKIQEERESSKPQKSTRIPICQFCGQQFSNRLMATHYDTFFHPFRCLFCPHTFTRRGDCKKHLCEIHGQEEDGDGNSGIVSGSFLLPPSQVKRSLVDGVWYKCSTCSIRVADEYSLIIHYKLVHRTVFKNLKLPLMASLTNTPWSTVGGSKKGLKGKTNVKKTKKVKNDGQTPEWKYFSNLSTDREVGNKTTKEQRRKLPEKIQRHHPKRLIIGPKGPQPSQRINQPSQRINEIISCDICSKIFLNERGHSIHMYLAHNGNGVSVDGARIPSSSSVGTTISADFTEQETMNCIYCGVECKSSDDLISHYSEFHQNDTESFSFGETNDESGFAEEQTEAMERSTTDDTEDKKFVPLVVMKNETEPEKNEEFNNDSSEIIAPFALESLFLSNPLTSSKFKSPFPTTDALFCTECNLTFNTKTEQYQHNRKHHPGILSQKMLEQLEFGFSRIK